MNVSAACPQCGAIANPNDKFCNTCGTPLQRAGAAGGPPGGAPPPAPAQPQYAAAPGQPQYAQAPGQPQYAQAPGQPQYAQAPGQPQYAQGAFPGQPSGQAGYPPPGGAPPGPAAQYGAPSPRGTRCQLGHDILPGMSYCAQGHPIALDAMQFANDPNAAYAAPAAAPPPPAYGAPGGYGQPGGPPPFEPPRPAPAQGLGFGGAPAYQPPPAPQGGAFGGGAFPQPGPAQPVFQPAAVPPPQYAPPPGVGAFPQEADRGPAPVPAGAKQLRGFVVTFQSNPAGDFWPLSTGRTTVGRANAPEPADIALADATISSRHAAFNVDATAVMVEDTSSTNGTYVNEEHIGQNGRRELRDGDRVRFGGFSTVVKIVGRT